MALCSYVGSLRDCASPRGISQLGRVLGTACRGHLDTRSGLCAASLGHGTGHEPGMDLSWPADGLRGKGH